MFEAVLTIVLLQIISFAVIYKFRERIIRSVANVIEQDLVDWINADETQEMFGEAMDTVADKVMVRFKGMLGGLSSGVSRQLKAVENEVIADGIDVATGIPGSGNLAAKYLKKYPVLQMMLPYMLKQVPNQASRQKSGELGKI